MSKKRVIQWFGAMALSCLSLSALAAGSSLPIRLEHKRFDQTDIASIKRGADYFATQCMVCHAVEYLQHNKLAKSAGITIDKMPTKDQEWWFGTAPPDLSLIARSRTPDWIYTYLHSFYKDATRSLGSNNLLVPNSAMPNPFIGTQGEQALLTDHLDEPGSAFSPNHRISTYLELVKQGSLSADEFDQQSYDMVNFLVYASEPSKAARLALGWWVIGFLLLLIVLTYLLKKEYWRSVR